MVPNDVEVAVRCVFTAATAADVFTAEARMHAAKVEDGDAAGDVITAIISSDGLEPLRAWAQRHRAYHHPGAAVADHAVGHLRVVERHQPTGDDGNPTLAAPAAVAAAARAHQHLAGPGQVHADGEA